MRRQLALLGITAVAALATPAHALEVYRAIEGATVARLGPKTRGMRP